jgi:hypothetical protein
MRSSGQPPGSPTGKAPPSRLRAPSASASGLRQPSGDAPAPSALRRPGFAAPKDDKAEPPPMVERPTRPTTAPSNTRVRTAASAVGAAGGDGGKGSAPGAKEGLAAKVGMTGMGLSLAAPSVPTSFTIDLTQLKKTYTAADLRVTISVRRASGRSTQSHLRSREDSVGSSLTVLPLEARRSDGAVWQRATYIERTNQ